jgi:hypothetical protein
MAARGGTAPPLGMDFSPSPNQPLEQHLVAKVGIRTKVWRSPLFAKAH